MLIYEKLISMEYDNRKYSNFLKAIMYVEKNMFGVYNLDIDDLILPKIWIKKNEIWFAVSFR